MRLVLLIATAATLLSVATMRAEANPCSVARVDGRSLLPVPSSSRIRIVSERIHIALEIGRDASTQERPSKALEIKKKRFQIDYTFENPGRPQTVIIGFPVVVPVSEPPIRRKGPVALHGFSVKGRGVGPLIQPVQRVLTPWSRGASLHWCEGYALRRLMAVISSGRNQQYRIRSGVIAFNAQGKDEETEDQQLLGWYFWEQRFGHGTTRLRVQYATKHQSRTCTVDYVLRTARRWGAGTIGRLTVELSVRPMRALSAVGNAMLVAYRKPHGGNRRRGIFAHISTTRHAPMRADRKRGTMVWAWRNFKADRDLRLDIRPCVPD